jgi:hypothetical protein
MNQFNLWRGSIKFFFQFFTSSFISARFAISVSREDDGEWEDLLTQVIDVKGDTKKMICVPFLHRTHWVSRYYQSFTGSPGPYVIRIGLISAIAGPDPEIDAAIDLVVWMAGGPDVQFQAPVASSWAIPAWPPGPFSASKNKKKALGASPFRVPNAVKQCSIKHTFANDASPMTAEMGTTIDTGLCTSNIPVTMKDLLSRFYPTVNNEPLVTMNISSSFGVTPQVYTPLQIWLATHMCFRGGFRFKCRFASNANYQYPLQLGDGGDVNVAESMSLPDSTGWHNLSFPQQGEVPFTNWTYNNTFWSPYWLTVDSDSLAGLSSPSFISMRDDLELGFPMLPHEYELVTPYVTSSKVTVSK